MRPNSGWIAGINHGAHDASCVLTHEGKTVVWIEQDRLSRVKHAIDQSPADALSACLQFAGIELRDLDAVALGSDHSQLIKWLGDDPQRREEILAYSSREWLFPTRLFDTSAGLPAVEHYPHHVSHAASAFYPSGFKDSAVLVIDAMGEDTSTTIARCTPNDGIQVLKSYSVDDSLGYFYETAAEYAGFTRHDAGKFMGLAAYGRPLYHLPLQNPKKNCTRIWLLDGIEDNNGRSRIEARCRTLTSVFAGTAFPYLAHMVGEPMAYRDFAASVQATLERIVLTLAAEARESSNSKRLVVAGGVALNCSANGKLADSGLFESIFVQPASNDSGVALGAAIQSSIRRYGAASHPAPMRHAYWGLRDEPCNIREKLRLSGLPFEEVTQDQVVFETAITLCSGGTVAWHQGRGEIGPRALGARSVLGDPRSRATVVQMNRIKGREVWRPLAPSVRAEDFHRFFDGTPNPFMIIASRVKPQMVRVIPAVVHVDGTARPQAVEEDVSPLFHKLLTTFGERTGVPLVVNTSLNGKQEPICYRAQDTISFFQRSDITLLAIEHFLVRNPNLGK
ncbi:MAG TPA: carbamoyltransferase C-terminal domain-containing protein [Bryobacteraceae bacterium]|jgi:carbamoyltransferase|nr:carbamoyltransferase C-terminal domain-containing protein [Bryobacteraceae bacterium]